jgi:hypothetical protein
MLFHAFAAFVGALITAALCWHADTLIWLVAIPFGASLFSFGSALVLCLARPNRPPVSPTPILTPPPEIVWC